MAAQETGVTRTLLLDDHVAFADALALALNMTPDLRCVATSSDAEAVEELLRVTGAHLLVSDQQLADGTTGLDVIEALKAKHRQLMAVLLTGYPAPAAVNRAARLGVPVLSKSLPIKEIVTGLRQFAAGSHPENAMKLDYGPLSASEHRVLELLGEGRRVPEIAEALSLSVHTVRDHVKSILRKLDTSSQLEAVLDAQRRGLIAPPS